MRNHTSARFWKCFNSLPPEIQHLARDAYELLKQNPRHPSLQFKVVGDYRSVRVDLNYRSLGVPVPDGIMWFWIGTHAEYDLLVK